MPISGLSVFSVESVRLTTGFRPHLNLENPVNPVSSCKWVENNTNTQLGTGEWRTGNGFDRINKIDRIEEDIANPDICTNRFVDRNLREQVEKDLHVSTCSTRLENSLRHCASALKSFR